MKRIGIAIMLLVLVSGCNRCKPVVDLNICENATGFTRLDCYKQGVQFANCASICDNAKDAYWKDVCYKELAVREVNVKLCDKIKNESILAECLKNT